MSFGGIKSDFLHQAAWALNRDVFVFPLEFEDAQRSGGDGSQRGFTGKFDIFAFSWLGFALRIAEKTCAVVLSNPGKILKNDSVELTVLCRRAEVGPCYFKWLSQYFVSIASSKRGLNISPPEFSVTVAENTLSIPSNLPEASYQLLLVTLHAQRYLSHAQKTYNSNPVAEADVVHILQEVDILHNEFRSKFDNLQELTAESFAAIPEPRRHKRQKFSNTQQNWNVSSQFQPQSSLQPLSCQALVGYTHDTLDAFQGTSLSPIEQFAPAVSRTIRESQPLNLENPPSVTHKKSDLETRSHHSGNLSGAGLKPLLQAPLNLKESFPSTLAHHDAQISPESLRLGPPRVGNYQARSHNSSLSKPHLMSFTASTSTVSNERLLRRAHTTSASEVSRSRVCSETVEGAHTSSDRPKFLEAAFSHISICNRPYCKYDDMELSRETTSVKQLMQLVDLQQNNERKSIANQNFLRGVVFLVAREKQKSYCEGPLPDFFGTSFLQAEFDSVAGNAEHEKLRKGLIRCRAAGELASIDVVLLARIKLTSRLSEKWRDWLSDFVKQYPHRHKEDPKQVREDRLDIMILMCRMLEKTDLSADEKSSIPLGGWEKLNDEERRQVSTGLSWQPNREANDIMTCGASTLDALSDPLAGETIPSNTEAQVEAAFQDDLLTNFLPSHSPAMEHLQSSEQVVNFLSGFDVSGQEMAGTFSGWEGDPLLFSDLDMPCENISA